MTDNAPCKHGCGTSVDPEDLTCPSCGGQQLRPEFRPPPVPPDCWKEAALLS